MVVVDDHDGCAKAVDGSDQLILRLMLNSSCSSHDQHHSIVKLQGHPAESFEAFSEVSLRLYRGPDATPQAKAGIAFTSATSSKPRANISITTDASTSDLHSSLPVSSQAVDNESGDTERIVWEWLWRMTALFKSGQSNHRSKKATS